MTGLLQYLALRSASGLISILPGSAARWLGRVGGVLWFRLAGGRRRMSQRHMRRVMGEGADVVAASKAAMSSYGRYYAEALWYRGRRVRRLLEQTSVVGLETVIAARDRGNGMILALPHMGNWEAAAPVAFDIGLPIVAVAENLPNKRITDWFTRMRAGFGIEIVLATGKTEVMRKLEAALAANEAVALLSDRDLSQRGIEVVLFGEETTLPPGPATLAIRTGAPLIPVACYFDGNDRYRVVIRPPIPVTEGDTRSDTVRSLTSALAAEFANLIEAAPDQWHLVQPNWPSDRE